MLFMRAMLLGVALGGLVRRDEAKSASKTEEDLCGPHIEGVCAAMGASWRSHENRAVRAGLQSLMTSSATDTEHFLAVVGARGDFSCKDLCVATLKYAQTPEGGGNVLPPANAVVCEDAACTTKVSVDQDAVAQMAVKSLQAPDVSLEGMGGDVESTEDRQEVPTEDEPEPGDLTFTPQELTRSLLVLFDVYVRPSAEAPSDFLDGDDKSLVQVEAAGVNDPEFGPKIRRDRYQYYTKFAAKGAALVRTAILRVESRPDVVEEWFGSEARPRDVKNMFQKQLKTILDLHIKKGDCQGSTLAYVMVWTNTRTQRFVRSDRDHSGQYIVHMCEYFWDVIRDFDYRYGTIIHEAAHHHGPTDVKLRNGNTAYGRRNNLKLVREQNAYGDGSPTQGTMNNADNYMTAVLVLAQDQIHAPLPVEAEPAPKPPRVTRTHQWVKHASCSTECGATEHEGHSLADMLLGQNQCAVCKWQTRERWGGDGCGNGFSLGKKSFSEKVCCWSETCTAR